MQSEPSAEGTGHLFRPAQQAVRVSAAAARGVQLAIQLLVTGACEPSEDECLVVLGETDEQGFEEISVEFQGGPRDTGRSPYRKGQTAAGGEMNGCRLNRLRAYPPEAASIL